MYIHELKQHIPITSKSYALHASACPLLRLAHLYAAGETLGQLVNVSLSDLFLPGGPGAVHFRIISCC